MSYESLVAKPKEELTAKDVCSSIDSNKYIAQCKQAIYKAHYFDSKALMVCFAIKSDYDKYSCMSVIRNKEYTEKAIKKCLSIKKVLTPKCLQKNGIEKPIPVEEEQPRSSVD